MQQQFLGYLHRFGDTVRLTLNSGRQRYSTWFENTDLDTRGHMVYLVDTPETLRFMMHRAESAEQHMYAQQLILCYAENSVLVNTVHGYMKTSEQWLSRRYSSSQLKLAVQDPERAFYLTDPIERSINRPVLPTLGSTWPPYIDSTYRMYHRAEHFHQMMRVPEAMTVEGFEQFESKPMVISEQVMHAVLPTGLNVVLYDPRKTAAARRNEHRVPQLAYRYEASLPPKSTSKRLRTARVINFPHTAIRQTRGMRFSQRLESTGVPLDLLAAQ